MKSLDIQHKFGFSLICGLLFSSVCFADILFMDLNNNPKEIEAAKRAAAKRGERLIVVPRIDATQKANIDRASSAIRRAEANYMRNCRRNFDDACRSAQREMNAALEDMNKYRTNFRREDLKKELADLAKDKVNLSSVIISGHDGNGHFNGSLGDLSDRDIKAAFDGHPALAGSVRSLLLWGCYTTNIGSLENNWKKVLPNMSMIAGYDGSAPLGDKPANWGYLEDVLVKEKALTSAADQKALMSVFNSIRGINIVASSICVNQDELATPRGVKSIKKELENCKSLQSGELSQKFQCYEKAEPGCEDIPANTSSGPIRSLYNQIQGSKHCHEFVQSSMQIPTGDATLRLMFDKQVRKNFELQNKDGLKTLNELLKSSNLPENLQFRDIDKMTRRQFIDQIKSIEKEIAQRSDLIKDESGRIDDPNLLALKDALRPMQQLSYVGRYSYCVPFEWVEPNPRGPDECGWNESMKKAPDSGMRKAVTVRVKRDDESAEAKVVGSAVKEAQKKSEAALKKLNDLQSQGAPMAELSKASEEMLKYDQEESQIRAKASAQIAQERIDHYTEKIKNSGDDNKIEKSVYQEQLIRWQRVAKKQVASDGGMILGNGSTSNMSTAPSGAMMGGGMLPPNVQRPDTPPSPQPLPIPPQPR